MGLASSVTDSAARQESELYVAIARETLELADGQGSIQLLQRDYVTHVTARFGFSKQTALAYVKRFSTDGAVFVDKSKYQRARLVFNAARLRTLTGAGSSAAEE